MNKEEFNQHCIKNGDRIYVREKVGDKWMPVAINNLSDERRQYWIDQWFSQNRMPVMTKDL